MTYSVGIVNAEANVCSVRFHPASRYYLAYGCAGNAIMYRVCLCGLAFVPSPLIVMV